ncbi:MAG: SDR family oxidoreductase [Clostridiaceae bacterium]|jgi:NAD(P)-dependent dehydrogenase (short-subunit alcohol dehydrogenase family)|nr:SDR family oxidoreductase [Clostridiaceae bacterium]
MAKINVLITGGTSGIGLATIHKFLYELKNEVEIISLSRSEDKIKQALESLALAKKQVHFYTTDVSNVASLEKVRASVEAKFSKIDILINNAGNIIAGGVEGLSFQDWDFSMTNNLSSFFYVTKTFLELLKKSDYPSIVNISSISSRLSGASTGYSVAKAGVDMMTKCFARELSKYQIRVNSVNPGITKSGFQVHNGLMDEAGYVRFLEDVTKTYPIGLGECSDVSELIYYLTSDKARWITGSTYIIDGGRSVNI